MASESQTKSEEVDDVLGEAASKAIKKKFPHLRCAITKNEVPDFLFSEGLLTFPTFELNTTVGLSEMDKGRKFLNEIIHLVQNDPKMFEVFCNVLEEHGHGCKDLVNETRGICKSEYESLLQRSNADFESLKESLERYSNELTKPTAPKEHIEGIITYKIKTFVEKMFSTGTTKKEMDDMLYDLCYESFLIPPNLCDWALSLTKIKQKKSIPEDCPDDCLDEEDKPLPQPLPPMPCSELKDVFYHTLLCCHAVTCCPDSYPDFFSKNGHRFDEISMSLSDLEQCLVAVRGNTMYVAFKSESSLSDWVDHYRSFTHGLEEQSSRISYAFFFEHLENKRQLVFTGFSFGGLLACYVTATLWKESYIPVPDLEKNVVCVTYGQPLVKVALIEQVMSRYYHFQDTIYHVHNKEDIFPRVLRFFSCKQRIMTALQSSDADLVSHTVKSPDSESDKGASQDFSQQFPQSFIQSLIVLQNQEMSYSAKVRKTPSTSALSKRSVEELKELLGSVSPTPNSNALPGRYCYLSGPQRKWTEFPNKEIAVSMLNTLPDEFTGENFTKHSSWKYFEVLQQSFISTEPTYIKPLCNTKSIPKVSSLKPIMQAIDIHIYENEHAVVLEGENLSFCYAVQLGEMKRKFRIDTPEHITSRMIRFNFPPTDKTRQVNVRNETIKVTLYPHFSKRIQQTIKLKTENFLFSVRQIQMAKYTPAEIIQIAFMSALLERRSSVPGKQEASERVKTIANFLQEAVKVVPLESVFHAISYLDDNSDALDCANAVISSKIAVSNSSYSRSAANIAAVRMNTGIKGNDFISLLDYDSFGGIPLLVESVSFPSPQCIETKLCPDRTLRSYSAAVQNKIVLPPVVMINTPMGPVQLSGFNVRLELSKSPPFTQPKIAKQLLRLGQTRTSTYDGHYCKLSIEQIYPVDSHRRHALTASTLESPREVLQSAKRELNDFLEDSQVESDSTQNLVNEKMLDLIRDIYDHKLKICAALLASFMETQIHIPLLKDSSMSTANLLSTNSSPQAVGVWALFTKTFQDLLGMLTSTRGNPVLVKIADYMSGVLGEGVKKRDNRSSKYDGKLQFILQGFTNRTITSSTEYVSYSLEHQLCKHLKFQKDISIHQLVEKWDKIFKGDALSLIAVSHRYITARWLKWAILIHDLRLALAKYICVGVTGLVNSGKSQLVKKLFGVQTQVGSLEKTRTTIPLLYNLDGVVDGLDVIDFPGVDDKEHNIPKLAEMLLGLAQIVVFVCDHKRLSTDQARKWIKELESRDVPVIVCLTFADELYSHFIKEDSSDPNPSEFKQRKIKKELELKRESIGHHVSREVDFYCFNVPDSYRKEINTQSLKKVGIGSPFDVGDKLVKVFRKKFKQENVAEGLCNHILKLRSPATSTT